MASESMKNMSSEDFKLAAEQLKHTRPEEMAEIGEKMANASPDEVAGMRASVEAQIKYQLNAAEMLKKQGNDFHNQGRYDDALKKYMLAKENIKEVPSFQSRKLLLACSLNLMSCYLKTRQYNECITEGSEVLAYDEKTLKALYRRGQAYKELGLLKNAVSDLSKALEVSPDDDTIAELLLSSLEQTVVRPKKSGDSKSTANNGNPKTNADSLDALMKDPEAVRLFQNFISSTDPAMLASLNSGQLNDVSPDMIKTICHMISKMSPGELQKMLDITEDENVPSGSNSSSLEQTVVRPKKSGDCKSTANNGNPKTNADSLDALMKDPEAVRLFQNFISSADPAMLASWNSGQLKDPEAVRLFQNFISSADPAMLASLSSGQLNDVSPDMIKTICKMISKMSPGELQKMLDITEDENVPSGSNSSSLEQTVVRPKKSGDSKSTANNGNPKTNADSLYALKKDPEAVRSFQNFISSADPAMLASLNSGQLKDVSPDMSKTTSDMISKMSSGELQKMLDIASSFQGDNPSLRGGSPDSSFSPGSMPPNVTPDMFKAASDMISKMPADDLKKMFGMASSLKGKEFFSSSAAVDENERNVSRSNFPSSSTNGTTSVGESSSSHNVFSNMGSAPQSSFPSSSANLQEQMRNQMKDPAMWQMFTSMVKNMSPEMMANMGEQFGVKLSPEEAAKVQQAMSSLSPESLDKMIRCAYRIQRGVESARKMKNWILVKPGIAICMLILAVILHRLGFIGG